MQIRGYNISYVNKFLKRFREISLTNLGKKMKDAKNSSKIKSIIRLLRIEKEKKIGEIIQVNKQLNKSPLLMLHILSPLFKYSSKVGRNFAFEKNFFAA